MTSDSDLRDKLHKLSVARIVFSALLLGSTLFVHFGRDGSPDPASLAILYGLIAAIFMLSSVYLLILKQSRNQLVVAYFQTLGDTLIVTIVLFVTGGFSSLFTFLYLVVIVTSSLLLPRRGTVLIAALCSIQFGLMADLEYYGLIRPLYPDDSMLAIVYGWDHVITKIIAIMVACVVVAFLSSFLSEQVLRTKRELRVMEEHVKRVEKMAAIGEMAAGLAHEIKNPLASLSGAIQLLREDIRYDPDHDRLMQIILREADRLSALASNFLLYARPPAGKPEPIELDKALRETVELFDKKGDTGKRVATTLKTQPGIWICMDPGPPAADSLEPAGECDRSHRRLGRDSGRARPRQGQAGLPDDRRLRHRHGAGDAQVHLRPLFHDQALRDRPGPVHRAPHPRRLRLPPGRGERARPGEHLQPASEADRDTGAMRPLEFSCHRSVPPPEGVT